MKLCGSIFQTFIKQNYESEDKITDQEKLNIVSYILTLIDTKNYYLKNLISNILGFIAAKEFPNCYESFIKILLDKLNTNTESNINENQIDEILRIFISVLKYCDDDCAIITGNVLPVIINIFKINKNNQKNREKCLIIISLFLNKLSYADGNDVDFLSNALDNNSLMENSIYLFTSILISNPKMLLDIKKYTIRILDILVRDMPIYSSKFFNLLIEPAWRLIVLELSLYCNSVVFNKEIEYTEDEEITMEEENHIYEHGYESDDDEEINGKGEFSLVYRATLKSNGDSRAFKVIKKDEKNFKQSQELLREIQLLEETDNPYIVKMYEFYDCPRAICLINEYLKGGSIYDKIKKEKKLSEFNTAIIIFQVLSALSFCHSHKIIHRNLNLTNILIDIKDPHFTHIKIIDFSTSAKMRKKMIH